MVKFFFLLGRDKRSEQTLHIPIVPSRRFKLRDILMHLLLMCEIMFGLLGNLLRFCLSVGMEIRALLTLQLNTSLNHI